MNMYVSNLAFQVTEQDLRGLFEPFGEIDSINVIVDKVTGRSRGFAFVEMSDSAAEKAMQELEGTQVEGRAISVSKAKPKTENRSGGFSSGRERSRF